VTIVKFGVRVRTWNSLPVPNFVRSLRGICPFGKIFTKKIKIFTIFSYLSPHFYTHSVKILIKRTDGLRNPSTTEILSKSLKGPAGIALPPGYDAY